MNFWWFSMQFSPGRMESTMKFNEIHENELFPHTVWTEKSWENQEKYVFTKIELFYATTFLLKDLEIKYNKHNSPGDRWKKIPFLLQSIFPYQITYKGDTVFGHVPSLKLLHRAKYFRNSSDFNRGYLRAQWELEARTRCKMKLRVHIF